MMDTIMRVWDMCLYVLIKNLELIDALRKPCAVLFEEHKYEHAIL